MERVSENFKEFEKYVKELQIRIVKQCESLEQASFNQTEWDFNDERKSKNSDNSDKMGGGLSILVEQGHFFEKAGVNTSSVGGVLSQEVAELLGVSVQEYAACGISLVLHPQSPMIPSVHFNLRLFELGSGDYWFGGGTDLTPYVPFEEDFRHFHKVLREAVVKIYPEQYLRFKEACDRYFYLPHRKEMRGVGGVFFDYLKGERSREYRLVRALGAALSLAWFPLAERRKELGYNQAHKTFQRFRHGRYVEFNLLYDRGTAFGLKAGGRVESILMSLPFNVIFASELSAEVGALARAMSPYYQVRDWTEL